MDKIKFDKFCDKEHTNKHFRKPYKIKSEEGDLLFATDGKFAIVTRKFEDKTEYEYCDNKAIIDILTSSNEVEGGFFNDNFLQYITDKKHRNMLSEVIVKTKGQWHMALNKNAPCWFWNDSYRVAIMPGFLLSLYH